jgi:hypothetical protein
MFTSEIKSIPINRLTITKEIRVGEKEITKRIELEFIRDDYTIENIESFAHEFCCAIENTAETKE